MLYDCGILEKKGESSCLRWRIRCFLGLCVLFGCLALGGPSVDDGDFFLEGSIDEAMALERVETLKLGRHDEGVESLSTAARHVCDFNVCGFETLLDGLTQGLVCDLRRHCFQRRIQDSYRVMNDRVEGRRALRFCSID
jgi:hypothetical protein